MEDQQILDLYFARSESAITETDRKYGRYCHSIAYNILEDHEDAKEIVNDTYLKTSGDEAGIDSYSNVYDLLVWWHYQEIFLPEITVEESHFNPLDESQVDLSGIVNAKEEEPVEEGVG